MKGWFIIIIIIIIVIITITVYMLYCTRKGDIFSYQARCRVLKLAVIIFDVWSQEVWFIIVIIIIIIIIIIIMV